MRNAHEIGKNALTLSINLFAATCLVGAGIGIGYEMATQFAVAQDQKNIDECAPRIANLPTSALSMDCRNVKEAMARSQSDLINNMHDLRDAYLTLGRRQDEAVYIDNGMIIGGVAAFLLEAAAAIPIFAYNRKDRRSCAAYKQQVSQGALYDYEVGVVYVAA